MTGKSHIWFGISLSPYVLLLDKVYFSHLQIEQSSLPLAYGVGITVMYIGFRFPDLDLKIKKFLPKSAQNKRYHYHRQFTHSLLLWFSLIALTYLSNISDFIKLPIFMFIFGVFTHLIGDMLTGTVPIFLHGTYRKGAKNRLGIVSFFPWKHREIFTQKFPKFLQKNSWIFATLFFINMVVVSIILLNINIV